MKLRVNERRENGVEQLEEVDHMGSLEGNHKVVITW